MNKKVSTLAIIHDGDRVLLGMKKRGFGAGRWNGFGGKVEEGETVEEAATREMKEEAGIEAVSMERCGVLEFTISGESFVRQVHVFKVLEWKGKPQETEEMKPEWFASFAIPFEHMWPDDQHWFPFFLGGKKFIGKAHFPHHGVMESFEFKEVADLDS